MLHRQLAEAGGHVVMAVRNPKAANDLIKKWQENWSGKGLPLDIEVLKNYNEVTVNPNSFSESPRFPLMRCAVCSWNPINHSCNWRYENSLFFLPFYLFQE